MRVYIAGPIAGNPDYKEQFAEAEAMLKDKFDDIFNPAKEMKKLAEWLPVNKLIYACCYVVEECDAIVMLPGWRKSKGSWLEITTAFIVGAEIMELRDGELCQLQKSDIYDTTPLWCTPELEEAMAFYKYDTLYRCRTCKVRDEAMDDDDDFDDDDDIEDDGDDAE